MLLTYGKIIIGEDLQKVQKTRLYTANKNSKDNANHFTIKSKPKTMILLAIDAFRHYVDRLPFDFNLERMVTINN